MIALGVKKIFATSESIKSNILKLKNLKNYQKICDNFKKCMKDMKYMKIYIFFILV